jgi:hypothetical protein
VGWSVGGLFIAILAFLIQRVFELADAALKRLKTRPHPPHSNPFLMMFLLGALFFLRGHNPFLLSA